MFSESLLQCLLMIREERLRQQTRPNYPIDAFNDLTGECDSLMNQCFDIRSDLVSLRPELHPGLNLATVALFNDSISLVDPCECLFEVSSVAQLLTLIQYPLYLLRPLRSLLLIVGCLDLNHCLSP